MTILSSFKEELMTSINYYVQQEGELNPTAAKDVLDAKHIIDVADSPTLLKQQLVRQLKKVHTKFFSFLPFVTDLKKEIEIVLRKPEYDSKELLIGECYDLRSDNKLLREENKLLKAQFEEFKKNGIGDHAIIIQNLQEEVSRLNEKMELKEKQYTQEIELVDFENKQLKHHNHLLTQANLKLQQALAKECSEKESLSQEYLLKIEEISQLKSELSLIKINENTSASANTSPPSSYSAISQFYKT